MPNTLVISTELPVAPMTGGRIRTYELARALATMGPVIIAGFVLEGEEVPPLEPPLRAVGVPWAQPPLYAQMESADEAISSRAYRVLADEVPEPWIVSCYESGPMRETIRELCRTNVDLVVLEHSVMGAYLAEVPRELPTVLDLHNVHWLAADRAAKRGLEDPRERDRVRAYEARLLERCTLTIAVSEAEADAARQLDRNARVEVVPNGVDTEFYVPTASNPAPSNLLFTGLMNYEPNVEAVSWFAREILPLIEGSVLHVVGSRPAPEVQALASETLIVHGEVPDTRPYQRQASVVVVPLLSGGGTRLKILEAAACGKAIVSTSLGAEGLDFVPGRDLLIADSASEFARAVESVLSDDELRVRLGGNARKLSEEYAWDVIGGRLLELVGPLAGPSASQEPPSVWPALVPES